MRKILLSGAAFLAGLALAPIAAVFAAEQSPAVTQNSVVYGPVNPHRNAYGVKRGVFNQMYTHNWSGYFVASYQTSQLYSSAAATWQVPSASYMPFNGTSTWEYSVNWVGIGGFCQNSGCSSIDQTLIQLGTGQSAANSGGSYYFAWYELLPAAMTVIPNPVNPGDIVNASLQCTANCSPNTTQTWVLTMTDETAGWTWTETFQYQTGMGTAEWIVEAPSSGGTLPLADYTLASFDELYANQSVPSLSLSANGLVMQDPWGQTSNASDLSGSLFSTCWGSGTSLTSCSPTAFTAPPPPPPAAPTVTLAANPSTISAGQSSSLSWSSANATSCAGGNFTANNISGSASVAPTATTTYSVSCSGAGGSSTAQTTVHVGTTTTTNTKKGGPKK